MAEFPIHPAAELFPMMNEEQYARLRDDIARNGLREPITLCEAKVLDGRNRLRACDELGIEPKLAAYDGDSPVAFVWSLNGARRHLAPSQLGLVAMKMLPQLKAEAKKRQATSTGGVHPQLTPSRAEAAVRGEAIEQAAKIVGIGRTTVQRIVFVEKHAPELLPKIESGELSAFNALEIAKAKVDSRPGPPIREVRLSNAMRAEQIAKLAADGHVAAQIADKLKLGESRVRSIARENNITLANAAIGKTHKINAHRVIESTVHGLEGYAQGLQTINGGVKSVDRNDAAAWAASLRSSLATINSLRKQLVRHATWQLTKDA